jgi:lysophospholipase L1-like esterase
MRLLSSLVLCALVGCGSGCDGERGRAPGALTPPRTSAAGSIGPDPRAGGPAVAGPGAPASAPAPAPAASGGAAATAALLDAPPGSLDPLFTGLAAAERGEPTGRVLWLFFGDSHTAGDSLTSRLRVTLQSRFGDAGRGLVAAGRPPIRNYSQRDVRYGASGAWKAAVGGHKGDPEPYGIAGLRIWGQRKGAELWVETCAACQTGHQVAAFEILYYAAPGHGVLRYRVDDQRWRERPTRSTAGEPAHPARELVAVSDGPHRLTLAHGGGGVLDLFGVVLERGRPGVVVDALGVVGRRLGSLRSWDWAVIGEQLASRDPRLVVLQYGTNEADQRDLDLEAMGRYFDETILRIRAASPTAAILVLGPPDLAVREAGKSCDHLRIGAPEIPECAWRTPAILGEIISVEHAAALRNRVAFFDSFAAMGGADRMHGWSVAEPRLAFKDHVHLTDLGYQAWADALSAAVLGDYQRWRAAHGLPPTAREAPPVPPAPPPAPPAGSSTPSSGPGAAVR